MIWRCTMFQGMRCCEEVVVYSLNTVSGHSNQPGGLDKQSRRIATAGMGPKDIRFRFRLTSTA